MAITVRNMSMPLIKCEGIYTIDNGTTYHTTPPGGSYLSSVPVVSGFNVTESPVFQFVDHVDITMSLGSWPTGLTLQSYAGHSNLTSTKIGVHTFDETKGNILYSTNADKLPSLNEGTLYFKSIAIAYPDYEYSLGDEVIITGSRIDLTACTFWAGQVSEANRLFLKVVPGVSLA